MPNRKDKRFDIARYMKERKEARCKVVEGHRALVSERKKIKRLQIKVNK